MRKILALSLAIISCQSYAAFNALSHHSRANCAGFNETVSWYFNHPFHGRVISRHYPYGMNGSEKDMHFIDTDKNYGMRHAAYHSAESYGGTYCVVGNHYMYVKGSERLVQSESVLDCDIYDGWWDY